MKTCLAIQSIRSCTLEEAAGIAHALGFTAMDLDGVMDTTLRREGILKVYPAEVKRVKELQLTIPNIHWTFATGNLYPAINDPDPKIRLSNKEQVQRLVGFCQAAGIGSILVLPGMFLPNQSAEDARMCSAEALNEYAEIGEAAKVGVYFEPHVKCAFEAPEAAAWLAIQAPGTRICLDYAHFICQGYTQAQVDALIPFTGHVHMRQARPGLLQARLDDGTINFALVLDNLRQAGYAGYLCVENVYQDYIGANNVDVLTETVKMRDFIKANL